MTNGQYNTEIIPSKVIKVRKNIVYQKKIIKQFDKIHFIFLQYPTLVQPIFLLKYFKKIGKKGILIHQYSSFIRDSLRCISLSQNRGYCFTRKIFGNVDNNKDKYDFPFSFCDYLCIKKKKMFEIFKINILNKTKINNVNTFSLNNKTYIKILNKAKGGKNTKEIYNVDKADNTFLEILDKKEPSLSQNQLLIKIFGWKDAIILSQILYWMNKNKKDTFFTTYLELSKFIFLDRNVICKADIWKYFFITREKNTNNKKIKISINFNLFIMFLQNYIEKK